MIKPLVLTSMPDAVILEKWNAFLGEASFATHYVTPNYFVDPYVGGRPFAVLAMANERIAAVLTGTHDRYRVVSGMFSRPQMAFCPRSDRREVSQALLAGLIEIGGRRSVIDLYSWEHIPELADLGMTSRNSGNETSIVTLDLSVGPEKLFSGFSQTRRNDLRRAIKQELVEIKQPETDDELDGLYQIYVDWNSRKGHKPGSFDQMKTAVTNHDNRRTFVAKANGQVIAGSFFRFCPGGVVEYAANFSTPKYQRLRPNDLLGWRAIEWACESGFTLFSMGGSHLFLRRFGGEVMTTYRYRLDQTRLRLYDRRETVREMAFGAYRRLPENIRGIVRMAR